MEKAQVADPEEKEQERKALVADDNTEERETLSRALREERFVVVQAGSGREAIRFLESEHFDVVFIDVIMPGMHGLDLLKRVQNSYPNLPIIMCAGERELTWADKAISMGALDCLVKPVNAREVKRVLNWISQLNHQRPAPEEAPDPERGGEGPEKEMLDFHRQIFRVLGGKTEPVRIYHEISEGIRKTLSCETVLVFMENEQGELELTAGWGKDGEVRGEETIPAGKGLIGWVKEKREGIIVTDPREDSRFDAEVDEKIGMKLENVLLVPIVIHEKGLGVVEAANCRRGEGFTSQDLEFMNGMGPAMGVVMRIEWLHRNLESRIDDLAQAESQLERLKKAFLKSEKERREALKELKKAK